MEAPHDQLDDPKRAHASVEAWALSYLQTEDLQAKRCPEAPPRHFAPLRVSSTAADFDLASLRPGRPPELDLVGKTARSLKRSQIHNPRRRAQLLHTFWHHELQAAELMCWAILRFPDTPLAFRRGLLGVCLDEIRHMGLYEAHIERLGYQVGDFPVRDWFWQRVASCALPVQFVALMGVGFEGGNLDHTRRFEGWFRDASDEEGADLQRLVGDEEVAHVRFAWKWFCAWTGCGGPAAGDTTPAFDVWRKLLVDPLTPSMMKGAELDFERRQKAGLTDEFLAALLAWDQPA